MKPAEVFISNYRKSFSPVGRQKPPSSRYDFFIDFLNYIPEQIKQLENAISCGQFDLFYLKINDLKFLCEYSEVLNKNWFLLRAYSGGLKKIAESPTVKSTKLVYAYYFLKYGDRRILRNEHWFEQKRWEFLDDLNSIYTTGELEAFFRKYNAIVSEYFKEYKSELLHFKSDIEQIIFNE